MKNLYKEHSNCVATANNMIGHPYFLAQEDMVDHAVAFIDQNGVFQCWEEVAFKAFFKTKNGEAGPDATFMLAITNITKERCFDCDGTSSQGYKIVLAKKANDNVSSYHVVHEINFGINPITVVSLFYLAKAMA